MSISLLTDNPKQYQDIMKPKNNLSFSDLCAFIIACSEIELDVTCTAIERPDVNINKTRSLALSLGATKFVTSSYYP